MIIDKISVLCESAYNQIFVTQEIEQNGATYDVNQMEAVHQVYLNDLASLRTKIRCRREKEITQIRDRTGSGKSSRRGSRLTSYDRKNALKTLKTGFKNAEYEGTNLFNFYAVFFFTFSSFLIIANFQSALSTSTLRSYTL